MSYNLSDLTDIVNEVAVHDSYIAYKKLFGLLFPSIKRFSYSLLKSPELAEEVASDVMITLWRKRESITAIDNIKVYAFVIAKNLCLNILKKNSGGRIVSLDDIAVNLRIDNTTPEWILINDELRASLNNAINELPTRCKIIFRLVKEDGLSYKEVSEILDISIKTVDAQLVIATRRLSVSIKKEFNLSPVKKY
ncbi:RNA polymerase sigma factor [Mucilaginibacter ginsenosidivorax]|uniref:Sigma-70 family RNA polymerase sigma factor n=1 Tax=Mucilaginibacter ginsenosidivorax TaxID=862126 RepID=A0A5B8VYB0_9SPHI|nr:sigma-70 family RNA polymerase sigma factor [Mucilaginibacter ginsenosidivorax]QEC75625.1 sigma-70 family RNA polymerase sigma factor [Mucilaginibacter ginsenosidivorax]